MRLHFEKKQQGAKEYVCMFNGISVRQLNSGIMSEDEIGRLPCQKKRF